MISRFVKLVWNRWFLGAASVFLGAAILLVVIASYRLNFHCRAFPEFIVDLQKGRPEPIRGAAPAIIGHRGSGVPSSHNRDILIGNIPAALEEAVSAKVDWIEIDIRASNDNKLVVFHDEKLNTWQNKTTGSGEVAKMPFKDLTKTAINVDQPATIQGLDQLFARFNSDNSKWVFDIKAKGLSKPFLEWIDERISSGQLSADRIIIFGDDDILQSLKENERWQDSMVNQVPLGHTALWGHLDNKLHVLFAQENLLRRTKELGCKYLVLPAIFSTPTLVQRARDKGFEVWVYGTDEERDLTDLANSNVDGLIVDNPRAAIQLLRPRARAK